MKRGWREKAGGRYNYMKRKMGERERDVERGGLRSEEKEKQARGGG